MESGVQEVLRPLIVVALVLNVLGAASKFGMQGSVDC